MAARGSELQSCSHDTTGELTDVLGRLVHLRRIVE
jgi:hypothetical protein